MIPIVVILLALLVLGVLFSIGGNARRARESQERLEKHAIAQLPPPPGFDDCTADMIAAVREGNKLGAIRLYFLANGKDLDKAKARIEELHAALEAGPVLGRPPRGIFG